jgi:hypothetical protein
MKSAPSAFPADFAVASEALFAWSLNHVHGARAQERPLDLLREVLVVDLLGGLVLDAIEPHHRVLSLLVAELRVPASLEAVTDHLPDDVVGVRVVPVAREIRGLLRGVAAHLCRAGSLRLHRRDGLRVVSS